ncbi:hypothetical protein Droror1_Dr00023710 [Drosera rotundifolia]
MATVPVKVHGPAFSIAVSRVLACLFEKDVPFDLVNVNIAKGQHKSPDFLKLQPFGQVPAFQDGNVSLFESRSICRYIAEAYADRGNKKLYGGDTLHKAFIDQWLEAEGQSFNPPSSILVFQLVFGPRMKIKQDEAAINQNKAKLTKVLDVYDKRLADSKYLAGDEFSLADLSHLPNAHYLVTGTDLKELFKERENVGRWWEDISSRESWKKTVDLQKSPQPKK